MSQPERLSSGMKPSHLSAYDRPGTPRAAEKTRINHGTTGPRSIVHDLVGYRHRMMLICIVGSLVMRKPKLVSLTTTRTDWAPLYPDISSPSPSQVQLSRYGRFQRLGDKYSGKSRGGGL